MSDITSHVPSASSLPSASVAPIRPTPAVERRPRVWPAIVLIGLFWLARLVPPLIAPGAMILFYTVFFGSMAVTATVILWWLFASRLPWRDRGLGLLAFFALGALIAGLGYDRSFVEPPIAIIVYVLPVTVTAWGGWLAGHRF